MSRKNDRNNYIPTLLLFFLNYVYTKRLDFVQNDDRNNSNLIIIAIMYGYRSKFARII